MSTRLALLLGKMVQPTLEFRPKTDRDYVKFMRIAYLGSNYPYLSRQLVHIVANFGGKTEEDEKAP